MSFDLLNFSWQVKYCHLWIILKYKKLKQMIELVNECKNTDTKITHFEAYFAHKLTLLFVWNSVDWFGLLLWHINYCRLFNAKSIFKSINSSFSNNSVEHKYTVLMSKTFLFRTIQFSISIQFQCQKTVPFQTIQVRMSTQFSSIRPIWCYHSGPDCIYIYIYLYVYI